VLSIFLNKNNYKDLDFVSFNILMLLLLRRHERLTNETTIALVGKYTQFEDSYASVTKALRHAALAAERKLVLKVFLFWTL